MELAGSLYEKRSCNSEDPDRGSSSVQSRRMQKQWKDKIDVMILCGGSATDLPEQTPEYGKDISM